MDCCLCVAAPGSDLPMNTATAQRGSQAPVVHHFLPSNTYSSPCYNRKFLISLHDDWSELALET